MNITRLNSTTTDRIPALTIFIGSLNIAIIVLGVVGNTISFLVFRINRSFRTMPAMVFLSFVAVTDTVALFEWNLDHFVQLVLRQNLQVLSGCRIFFFAQYSSLQSSALLLSTMCLDRYVTVMAVPGSFLSRLPFRTVKNAFIWSTGIVTFCILLNFHLLITAGKLFQFKTIFLTDQNWYVMKILAYRVLWKNIIEFELRFDVSLFFNWRGHYSLGPSESGLLQRDTVHDHDHLQHVAHRQSQIQTCQHTHDLALQT